MDITNSEQGLTIYPLLSYEKYKGVIISKQKFKIIMYILLLFISHLILR